MGVKLQVLLLCALLLCTIGCQQKASSISVGPFDVDSNTGSAVGKAFEIDFKVAGASKAEVKTGLSSESSSPGRAIISLAEDIEIELVTMDDDKSVAFQFNGEKFGNLEKGDEVMIDEERNVTVNGKQRSATESSLE